MRAGEYRRTLDRISRAVADTARSVGRFLSTSARTDADLADAARVLHPVISAGREQAHDAAVAFLQGQAKVQGYTSTVPVPRLREYPQEALEKALKESVGGEAVPANLDTTLAKVAVRHTEDAARKTVEDAAEMSAEPDPATGEEREVVAWARQLTGAENCPFCVIMASRGAIYHSRRSAMGDIARKNSKGIEDGIHRYHNGCDCVAVPVYDRKKWEGNALARRLYSQVYKKAIEKYPEDDAFVAVRKYMVNDLDDDGLKIPQMRSDVVEVPEKEDDVPDFVSNDLLSEETRELIDGTADRLPRTDKEWEEIRQNSGMTALDRMRTMRALSLEERAKDESKKATDYKRWGDTDLEAEYRADAKKSRAEAKEIRAGKKDDEFRQRIIDRGDDPDELLGFDEDVDGKILPPQSHLDRVDEVQRVGRAALDDWKRALDRDPEAKEIQDELATVSRELEVHMEEVKRLTIMSMEEHRDATKKAAEGLDSVDDFLDALSKPMEGTDTDALLDAAQAQGRYLQGRKQGLQAQIHERKGDLLRQIVGSRRELGSEDDMDVRPGRLNLRGDYGAEKAATEEDLAKIRKAATLFPKEWVVKMNQERGELYVTTSPRGYYRAKSPFSNVPGDQINLSGGKAWHRGGIFKDSTEKTAAHEVGHRMEKTFPAIPALEWAYLYRRATAKGKRESLKWVGSGAKDEKALHDEFREAYTGKVYGDPDQRPWEYKGWEVFTTGLEALYGDDEMYQDADGDLQSFILGLLLTV